MAQNQKHNTEQALLNSIKIYLPDLIFTTNDLKKPTSSSVCNFYTAFLEELGGNTANVVQVRIPHL